MGSSISPFGQAQNSSLLPTFCLVRPSEFQNRDTSYLVQHPVGQNLQRLSQYEQQSNATTKFRPLTTELWAHLLSSVP